MLQFLGMVPAWIEGKDLKRKYNLVSSLKDNVTDDTSCFHQCVRELCLNLLYYLEIERKKKKQPNKLVKAKKDKLKNKEYLTKDLNYLQNGTFA